MAESPRLESIRPARVFDGGDLDCGSGLVLLIRESMLEVPVGEILEMRSREPTVEDDLPPWCRMSGHDYLGSLKGEGHVRYFIRRGARSTADASALAQDKESAKRYEWRARVRGTGGLRSTVFCRNSSFVVGQPASFDEKDESPSAVEYLLGALGGDLAAGLHGECARSGLALDDVELSLRGRLENVLAHIGLEEGDPGFSSIEIRCFVSTPEEENRVRAIWQQVLARSPMLATLRKAARVDVRLSFV